MRAVLRLIAATVVLLAGFAPPRVALAANLDTTADLVLGQADFVSMSANPNGVLASSLDFPDGMVLDAQGNLYVADVYNNRVLEYDWALAKLMLPLVRR